MELRTHTPPGQQSGVSIPNSEQGQDNGPISRMTGTRANLADSASSVAALETAQPPHHHPRHDGVRDESVSQHIELVPCQPATAEQQQHCGVAAAVIDSSDEDIAVGIQEKVERGVTAADDGRRSVKSLPTLGATTFLAFNHAYGFDFIFSLHRAKSLRPNKREVGLRGGALPPTH